MASSQVEGFVRSTGCLSTYAVRVVLSHQLHRGLGGRLWPTGDVLGAWYENGCCTQVLIDSFCSGAELYEWYCTGRSGVPLIGSCHISASVTKQVCCKRSCPGVPVWTQAEVPQFIWPLHSRASRILHRPYTLFFRSCHISAYVTKRVFSSL